MTAPAAAPRRRFDLKILAPLLGLVFLVILGASLNDNFLSSNNIYNVLTRSSFIGIIAVGMTFVILTGGIDLSVGAVVALSGMIAASLLQSGWSPATRTAKANCWYRK